MRKASLGIFLLFFSCTYAMEKSPVHREEVAADTLACATTENAQTKQLWSEAFDGSMPSAVPRTHQSAITQLLVACHKGAAFIDGKSTDQRRIFMGKLCKEATAADRNSHYDSETVQRAWNRCASNWDEVVSAMELLQPKICHHATHLAAYILAKLYEKSLPAITEEMVGAKAKEEKTATQFDDPFLELKAEQVRSLFERIKTTHPTLKTHINMYSYLVMHDFLRQRLEPLLKEYVNVNAFLKTYKLLPDGNSLKSVAAFIPKECSLLRQLINFKERPLELQNSILQKSWRQHVNLISSYMSMLTQKTAPETTLVLGPAARDDISAAIGIAIQDGYTEKAELMLSLYALNIDKFFNLWGPLPTNFLYLATLSGNIKIIKILLAKGADPLAKKKYENEETCSPYDLAKQLSCRHSPITKMCRFRRFSAVAIVKESDKPAETIIRCNELGLPIVEEEVYKCTEELRSEDDRAYEKDMHARYREIVRLFEETMKQPTMLAFECTEKTPKNAYLVSPSSFQTEGSGISELDRMVAEPKTLPQEYESPADPNTTDQVLPAASSRMPNQIENLREKPERVKKGRCCTYL